MQNPDGSTELYLGPKAPAGKEKNWLDTVPGRGYFAILRLYGPTETAIDKSWKPGDIEKVQYRVPWPEFAVQSVVHERRFRWLLRR